MIASLAVAEGLIRYTEALLLPAYWANAALSLGVVSACLPCIIHLLRRGWRFGPLALFNSREYGCSRDQSLITRLSIIDKGSRAPNVYYVRDSKTDDVSYFSSPGPSALTSALTSRPPSRPPTPPPKDDDYVPASPTNPSRSESLARPARAHARSPVPLVLDLRYQSVRPEESVSRVDTVPRCNPKAFSRSNDNNV